MNEPPDIGGEELRECPFKFIGDDMKAVASILDVADEARQGMWPAGGGTYDQAAACIDGVRCVWGVEKQIDERLRSGRPY